MVKKKIKKIRHIRGMGWLPDVPDKRDFVYKIPKLKIVRKMPDAVNLMSLQSPVEDQGDLGSCTANAIVGAIEYIQIAAGEQLTDLSRLFLYWNERYYIKTIMEDSGAYIRDGIKVVNRRGICPENLWPYDISKFTDKPSKQAFDTAKKNKSVLYQRLTNIEQMKACLATGFPFVFGFSVYDSFVSQKVANDGQVPMPDIKNENMLGGHAVLCIGYDNSSKRFICKNSWGTNWGMNGYFTIPYDYLADRNLSEDFWTIRI